MTTQATPKPRRPVVCPYCRQPAERVLGSIVYPGDARLAGVQFYRCKPCDARIGCHDGGDWSPKGRLANAELRALKEEANRLFNPIRLEPGTTRRDAYRRLATAMGIRVDRCHLGWFNKREIHKAIELLKAGRV